MTQPSAQSASLYVGDLAPDVTEQILFDTFREVGPVLSIRVCRDAVTRRSLGYAYVNFQNPYDAERTIEALNFIKIKSHPCRIMWSHRDPTLRKAGRGNIFIKNLDESIDNKALYDTFSAFGNILSCKVKTADDPSKSAGYGFVHFETEESAQAAIDKVNGMLLNNRQVFVGNFVHKNARSTHDVQETFTNVYIKNLNTHCSTETLKSHFSKFGAIVAAAVMPDLHANEGEQKNRGFGFVNFEEHEAAVHAVSEMHEKEVADLSAEGKKLYVSRAQKKQERKQLRDEAARKRQQQLAKYVNLYIKNLDDQVDDEKLRTTFTQFGKIISARVMRDDKTGTSRGFGFVCFEDPDAANKAVSELNTAMVLGSKPLYVAVAQKKEARRAHLEQQFQSHMGRNYPGMQNPGPQAPHQMQQYGANFMPPGMFYPGGGAVPPNSMQQMYMYGQGGPQNPGQGRQPMQPNWARGQAMPVAGGYPQGQPVNAARPAGQRNARAAPGPRVGGPTGSQPPVRPQGGRGGGPAGGAAGGAKVGQPPMQGGQGQSAGFTYTKTVRNAPANVQQQMPQQVLAAPQSAAAIPGPAGQEPLTANALAAMNEETAKNALGERLFMRIQESNPTQAAKVTGMLLELDNTELLNLLESPEVLQQKIGEALHILENP